MNMMPTTTMRSGRENNREDDEEDSGNGRSLSGGEWKRESEAYKGFQGFVVFAEESYRTETVG